MQAFLDLICGGASCYIHQFHHVPLSEFPWILRNKNRLKSIHTAPKMNNPLYPIHAPGQAALRPSNTGPSRRARAAAPAVAILVSPRYLPADSGGASELASAQLEVRKRPMPAPRTLPKTMSPRISVAKSISNIPPEAINVPMARIRFAPYLSANQPLTRMRMTIVTVRA